MDITEVFALLDKYNLRDKAKNECKRRKIDEAPYDHLLGVTDGQHKKEQER